METAEHAVEQVAFCGGEVIDAGAGRVELSQQGEGLTARRLFDEGEPPHLWEAEDLAEPVCLGVAVGGQEVEELLEAGGVGDPGTG
jgi:hypothetical protein